MANAAGVDRAVVTGTVLTDDVSWVTAAQGGDIGAFEHLYRHHVGRVYGLCLRMTANVTDAQELTQETFLRAWEKLGRLQHAEAFGTWLHRIAVSVVMTRFRSRSWRSWREADPLDVDSLERDGRGRASSGDPGVRMDLEAAMATLPARARAVFVLHDVEGYRHEEIAEQMGIAPGASRAHLHNARRLLRERMER